MPNQLVMVIARPINLNVSCKLHPSSLQRTQSSPGPGPPKRVGNMHTCNYYDLKGKDIDVTCAQSVVAGSISSGGNHGIHC